MIKLWGRGPYRSFSRLAGALKTGLGLDGVTGVYFGRSLASVPPGSVVLFPYEPNRLSCGITAILAYKRPASSVAAFSFENLTRQIQALAEALPEITSPDPVAPDLSPLNDLAGSLDFLKTREGFTQLFAGEALYLELSQLGDRLEAWIEAWERTVDPRRGRGSDAPLVAVKDVLWTIRREMLENVDLIQALGDGASREVSPETALRLQDINLALNNLDRLEVRGRDSAGLSVLGTLPRAGFDAFVQSLREENLIEEFETRQSDPCLTHRSITLKKTDTACSITLTYKVAAEVGRLGDNVRFLRSAIQGDALFQHLIRWPDLAHTTLAHTRWASVGAINEVNCHPMDNDPAASEGVIHVCLNGDIDNFQDLRRKFESKTGRGIDPTVTTDTKIIPLKVEEYLGDGHDLLDAFRLAVNEFEGSHAIAMHSDLAPGQIFLAQRGSGQAIFVGLASDQYLVASEIYGLVEKTHRYLKLDGEKTAEGLSGPTQGQLFVLSSDSEGDLAGIRAMYYDGTPIALTEEAVKVTEITTRDIDRQKYPHYFLKEVSESPHSVEQTLWGRVAVVEEDGRARPRISLDASVLPERLAEAVRAGEIKKFFFIGQGTAGVAAQGCAALLSEYLQGAAVHVAAARASEFSGFMLGEMGSDTLVTAISQSGTTTDTNRAVDMARERGAWTLAIVNRRDSDITFKVDGVLYTSNGRDIEMSVASTKAYYSQIAAGAVLGLRLAQLLGRRSEEFLRSEIELLWRLPSLMRKVLDKQTEISRSADRLAVTRKYWAVVGSGPNKISADEIRIKLSELCYKTISSDAVEDKKHIDLSAEPLIFVCAAGNREDVVGDIIKDTAIFRAHQALPVVVTTEGETRFNAYAETVIQVPHVPGRFAPILNTLAGHLWGYYAALAINEESRRLYEHRAEVEEHVNASVAQGLNVYEIILDETFREQAARIYRDFKERIRGNRYASALSLTLAADLTLLLKYLAGRLPTSDFELDFGLRGTAPNMLSAFYDCIGRMIEEMVRPVDAIKHQAKTVTVGTSRLAEVFEGLLFDALRAQGFDPNQLSPSNVLVLKRLQAVVGAIQGATLYGVSGLNILGEPVEESSIRVIRKEGSAKGLPSRSETDPRLRGTKRIIVRQGNVFIGRGRRDERSILVVPVLSAEGRIDHLLLWNVDFKKEIGLDEKISALGGKYDHIRNLVEETHLVWRDEHLDLVETAELFGMSAEKVSESIVAQLQSRG